MATYVYKYVHPKYDWLYIGKSDVDLRSRINVHKKEFKFKPFLRECEIYYIQLNNKAQSKAVESYLIDKYKPYLNTVDKYDGESILDMTLPEWIPYKSYKKDRNCLPKLCVNEFELQIEKENNEIANLKKELLNMRKQLEDKNLQIIKLNNEIIDKQVMFTEFQIDYNRKRDYPNLTIEEFEEKLRNVFNSDYFRNGFNFDDPWCV